MEMKKSEDQSPPRSATTTESQDTQNTPPLNQMNSSPVSGDGSSKIATPSPLMVPKAFKYPEMYTSPTDLIMSPVSKGLLARTKSKKASFLLPPSSTRNQQHKLQVQASKFEDLDALKI